MLYNKNAWINQNIGVLKMKVKKAAKAIIILGSLTIASFVCPSPCPHLIFGAMIVAFGIVLFKSL
jgi:hypothetical protein